MLFWKRRQQISAYKCLYFNNSVLYIFRAQCMTINKLIFIIFLNNRGQGMKTLKWESIQKLQRITLLLYHAILNHVLLWQYVSATVLLLIKLWVKSPMQLQTVVWLLLLMEVMQRYGFLMSLQLGKITSACLDFLMKSSFTY